MSEVQQEFARLRGVCTLADGNEKRMPPTQTHFESLMVSVEPHWVQLGLQLPGVEPGQPGVGQGQPLAHRSAAALKLIRNHEAVIRDVCNPLGTNVVGETLTQTHLKRVDVNHAKYVEEAMRLVAIKLLGIPTNNGVAPQRNFGDPVQAQVWAATAMFVLARMHLGDEKPGRTPDMAADAGLAMRGALMEVGREATGM